MSLLISSKVNLRVPAGKASPSPGIASALGQRGVNIMKFCQECNAKTSIYESGIIVNVTVVIFSNKTFTLNIKGPSASLLIKRALGLKKASSEPGKNHIAEIDVNQLMDIFKQKKGFMNVYDSNKGLAMLSGTARSMGIKVKS